MVLREMGLDGVALYTVLKKPIYCSAYKPFSFVICALVVELSEFIEDALKFRSFDKVLTPGLGEGFVGQPLDDALAVCTGSRSEVRGQRSHDYI